jgi:hypothetical protein
LFFVFFFFFLGWVSLSWLWPLALIGLGLFFLVKRR